MNFIPFILAVVFAPVGCDDAQPSGPAPIASESTTSPTPPTVSPEAIEHSLAAAEEYVNSGELGKAREILVLLTERAPREVTARELLGQTLTLMATKSDLAGRPEEAQDQPTCVRAPPPRWPRDGPYSPQTRERFLPQWSGRIQHAPSASTLHVRWNSSPDSAWPGHG